MKTNREYAPEIDSPMKTGIQYRQFTSGTMNLKSWVSRSKEPAPDSQCRLTAGEHAACDMATD